MKTFKEFINEKLNEASIPNQIGFDYKRSALEKILRAEKSGQLPFEAEHSNVMKEFGLTYEEINFLKKYSIIQHSAMGSIINKDNFSNMYQQITKMNPIL